MGIFIAASCLSDCLEFAGRRWGINKRSISVALLLVALVVAAEESAGASAAGERAVSLCFENDIFAGTDTGYTNGVSFALSRKDSGLLGGVWDFTGQSSGKLYSTYELTQLSYTPKELNRPNPDPADRPYAGVLYAGFMTQLQQERSLQSFKVIAGVVGPLSLSETAQSTAHHVLGISRSDGWDFQLRNEPVANLFYEYRHKFRLVSAGEGFVVELLPMGSASLGNLSIQTGAEAQLRIGSHVGDDFGATHLRGTGYLPVNDTGSVHPVGGYLFIGGGGSLVGRDLSLDGNTFRDGPEIDKYPFVRSVSLGAALRMNRLQASFVYIMKSKEFSGQKTNSDYGSVKLTYSY